MFRDSFWGFGLTRLYTCRETVAYQHPRINSPPSSFLYYSHGTRFLVHFTMENPEGRRRDIATTDGLRLTGSSVVAATAAAVAVVGPLFGLMCFSLVATVTLFLIASPLMLIFAPVLMGTVAILVAAMVGVGVAAALWVLGIAALVCCAKEIGVETGTAERMVESVVRELGYGRSRYLGEKSEDGYSSFSSR